MKMTKFEQALHRHAKRMQQGLAGVDRRTLQRAGQEPRVLHDGRITHSMRTIRQRRYENDPLR